MSKLTEKKNVSLAVVLLSNYCTEGNITDVMQMGAIKSPNQDADLRSIRLSAAPKMLVVGNGPSRHNVLISAKLLIQVEMKLRISHQDHYIHSSISKLPDF